MSRPSGIPYLNPSPPHITISCAEGVAAARSGEVLRAALGARALQPLPGTSFLHGVSPGGNLALPLHSSSGRSGMVYAC